MYTKASSDRTVVAVTRTKRINRSFQKTEFKDSDKRATLRIENGDPLPAPIYQPGELATEAAYGYTSSNKLYNNT